MTENEHHGNGTSRSLKAGIFAPIPSFFLPETEDLGTRLPTLFVPYLPTHQLLDLPPFEAHVVRTANAGVVPLIAGSLGEAIHLSHSERVKLIQAARKALDSAGLDHVPLIAGTGAGSTRETIELTNEAAAAGADFVIVIASGYFAAVLANNRPALKAFWVEVASKSPVPVMMYNCMYFIFHFTLLINRYLDPVASGGIDLDSDFITELARECPNICGIKLTYVNISIPYSVAITRQSSIVAAMLVN
jgi:L-threo-3-deoxy-hexylosonate aldolase